MNFVEANGLRFGYLEWGEGPLVLAMHGFPDTPHTWDVVGPRLAAEGFHVVAPFLRGYAPTAAPQVDATSRELGADVIALTDALGGGRAHLLGHDWGAEAVYAAVGLAPERFMSLTTVAIPHRAAVKPTPRLAWGLRHFITLALPGAEARFARDDFAQLEVLVQRWSPTWRPSKEELEYIKTCFRAPGTVHAALGYYRAASFRAQEFLKRKVSVPTLCVAGADDPFVSPADYEATASHFTKGFEVLAIPGGHFCHREAPDQLMPVLVRHIKSTASR